MQAVVTGCQAYGSQEAPPADEGGIDIEPCDISAKFGNDVMGKYTIRYHDPQGNLRETYCSCAHSMCTPEEPSQHENSCYTICGRAKCGQ